MSRKISWGQSDQTNTLNLVEALQKLAAEELEANRDELNTEVLAQWVSECKLRVTGNVKRKRGKREQTVEVGTTKKALVKLVEASGKGLELPKRIKESSRPRYERQAEAIQTVIDLLRKLEILEEEPSQKNQGYWKFSLNLMHQTKPAENLEKIRQKWQERTGQTIVETRHGASLQVTDEGINWGKICHAMLEKRRRATSNILMQEESAKFEREQIYVPLALVERRKQDKRDREFLPERGTQLYEPQYQETQRFEQDAFLSQILEKGEGKSQGKQIALIGEPGAGKTTLLQAIAFWLLEKNLGLPIWINLADLSGKDIGRYLLEVWLNQAIPPTRLNQQIRDDLVKQIEQGRVWLLLDGVDEIVASTVKLNNARNWGDSSFHSVPLRMTSENPLQAMAHQLTGWINQARVILTCRLNIWLASTNALERFETYRLLDFDYPHQVHQFIDNWFNPPQPPFERGEQDSSICLSVSQDTSTSLPLNQDTSLSLPFSQDTSTSLPLNQDTSLSLPLSKGESEGVKKAERLKAELAQPERIRIRDLVQNPLRLALLCSTWQTWEGHLPDTQAGLYQKFVQQFYIWKASIFNTDRQDELNQALGQLALRDLNESTSRFCLRESFIEQELGKVTDNNSLFSLALQLGWLNVVGVAAEKPDEKVYAFYHPTFEEYFAALAVEDWHFFLNHRVPPLAISDQGRESANSLKAPLLKGGWGDLSYRLFEPQWKQVILLWLGREDVENEQKEEFIQALVEFEDGCGDFYWYRAYFLAATVIQDFKHCSWFDQIFDKIVKFSFGYFDINKNEWIQFINSIKESANEILLEMDRSRVISTLVKLIYTPHAKNIHQQAVENLAKIGKDNVKAITTLVEFVNTHQDEYTRLEVTKKLIKIEQYNSDAIATLVELTKSLNSFIGFEATENLRIIRKNNPNVVIALVESLHTSKSESIRRRVAESLGIIDKGNPDAINTLIELIKNSQDEFIRWKAAESLGRIEKGNPDAINTLIELIKNSQDEDTCRQVAESLGRIDKGNPDAINTLIELIKNSQNEDICYLATESLGKIGENNPEAINTLIELIKNFQDEDMCCLAVEILGEIGENNPEAITALVQLLQTSQDEYTCCLAAYNLAEISKDNSEAIATLVQLIQTAQEEAICLESAYSLFEIDKNHPEPIAAFVKLIQDYDNLEKKLNQMFMV